jgi:hypothetical protein
MKNILSEITEQEKNRILEMHRKSTSRFYLNEQNSFNINQTSGSGKGATLEITTMFKNIGLGDTHTNQVSKQYAEELKIKPELKKDKIDTLMTLLNDLIKKENETRDQKDKISNYDINANLKPAAEALIDNFS